MCCSHMQHATGDCVWYVITIYKYCGFGEPVEEAGGWQIWCKKSTAKTVIKLTDWLSFDFLQVVQAQVHYPPPYFISPSPQANTILYSCYLCKQCALFLFLHSVNPAVSSWDTAAGADRAQSIPDSAAVFSEQLRALLDGGGLLWSILRQAVVKLHGADWERQEVKCLNDWERKGQFSKKNMLSKLWMVLYWCALVLFHCVDDN